MLGIQVLIISIVIVIVIRILLQFHKKKVSLGELLIWCILWFGVIIITLQPNITSYVADFVGIGRGVDLVVYLAIISLFYLFFRLFIKIKYLEYTISTLVGHIAKNNAKKTKKELK